MKTYTITIEVKDAHNFMRIRRVLAHIFSIDGGEWDGPVPKVEITYGEKGDVSDL
jgi:hypothetical protein